MWFRKKITIHWTDSEIKNVMEMIDEYAKTINSHCRLVINYSPSIGILYIIITNKQDFEDTDLLQLKEKFALYLDYNKRMKDMK